MVPSLKGNGCPSPCLADAFVPFPFFYLLALMWLLDPLWEGAGVEAPAFKVPSNGQVNKMKFRKNLHTSLHAALREEQKATGRREGFFKAPRVGWRGDGEISGWVCPISCWAGPPGHAGAGGSGPSWCLGELGLKLAPAAAASERFCI